MRSCDAEEGTGKLVPSWQLARVSGFSPHAGVSAEVQSDYGCPGAGLRRESLSYLGGIRKIGCKFFLYFPAGTDHDFSEA